MRHEPSAHKKKKKNQKLSVVSRKPESETRVRLGGGGTRVVGFVCLVVVVGLGLFVVVCFLGGREWGQEDHSYTHIIMSLH